MMRLTPRGSPGQHKSTYSERVGHQCAGGLLRSTTCSCELYTAKSSGWPPRRSDWERVSRRYGIRPRVGGRFALLAPVARQQPHPTD
eukprot:scaffold650_cov407-Prasinococcus_capsulatus_cf.AAC.21